MADDALTPKVLKMLGLDSGQLGARYSEASKGLAGATEEITKEQKAFKESAAPIKTKIAETRKEAPSEPKLEDVPNKFQHQGMSQDDLRQNMQIMFALAAIGGAMTRQPMTAALTAFNGAMTGMLQGDKITFERESKTFDENLRRVIAKNNTAVEQYRNAVEKNRNDIQGAMDDLNLLTIEHNDTIGNALIKANKYSDFMKHVENLAASTNKAEQAADKMDLQIKILSDKLEHRDEMDELRRKTADKRDEQSDFNNEDKIRKEFHQAITPVNTLKLHIDAARAAVASGTPFDTRQAQALLTQISRGSRATNLQIAMNKNWGDLGERMGRFANLFLSGNWTTDQKKEVMGYLDALEGTVVKPYIEAERKRAEGLAKSYKLNPKRVTMMDNPYSVGESDVSGATDGAFDAGAFLDKFKTTPR